MSLYEKLKSELSLHEQLKSKLILNPDGDGQSIIKKEIRAFWTQPALLIVFLLILIGVLAPIFGPSIIRFADTKGVENQLSEKWGFEVNVTPIGPSEDSVPALGGWQPIRYEVTRESGCLSGRHPFPENMTYGGEKECSLYVLNYGKDGYVHEQIFNVAYGPFSINYMVMVFVFEIALILIARPFLNRIWSADSEHLAEEYPSDFELLRFLTNNYYLSGDLSDKTMWEAVLAERRAQQLESEIKKVSEVRTVTSSRSKKMQKDESSLAAIRIATASLLDPDSSH